MSISSIIAGAQQRLRPQPAATQLFPLSASLSRGSAFSDMAPFSSASGTHMAQGASV